MNTNSRYSGQKLFFRHIAVSAPLECITFLQIKEAIVSSATKIAQEIKTLHSIRDISAKLKRGNDSLKPILDDIDPKKGNSRDSGKVIWVNSILAQFGVSPMSITLQRNAITPLIPEMARLILKKIVFAIREDSRNSQKTIKDGIPTQLVAILSGDATEKDKEYAAEALCNFSDNNVNGETLAKAGVPTQWVALLSGGANGNAKQYAAEGLYNLSRNKNTHPWLIANNIHISMSKLLAWRIINTGITEFVAGVLLNLSGNKANHPQLLAAGVHEDLGLSLSFPYTSDLEKEYAAEALCNISADPATCLPLVAAGVDFQFMELLQNGTASPRAIEYAQQGLQNCCEVPFN